MSVNEIESMLASTTTTNEIEANLVIMILVIRYNYQQIEKLLSDYKKSHKLKNILNLLLESYFQ